MFRDEFLLFKEQMDMAWKITLRGHILEFKLHSKSTHLLFLLSFHEICPFVIRVILSQMTDSGCRLPTHTITVPPEIQHAIRAPLDGAYMGPFCRHRVFLLHAPDVFPSF